MTGIRHNRTPAHPFLESAAMLLSHRNYDSFTFNLVHSWQPQRPTKVLRNRPLTPSPRPLALDPTAILLRPAPRPGTPGSACRSSRRRRRPACRLLGVCLGHQSIGEALRRPRRAAGEIVHGKLGHYPFTRQGHVFSGLPCTNSRDHAAIFRFSCQTRHLARRRSSTAAIDDWPRSWGIWHANSRSEGVQSHPEIIRLPARPQASRNFLSGP